MKTWGIGLPVGAGIPIDELIEVARIAESTGFDRVAVGENQNDPLTWMHAVAAQTHSVRVSSTILNIALRHPVVTAEALASMRDMYGDRFDLGLGVGHREVLRQEFGVEVPTLEDLADYAEIVRAVLEARQALGRRWRAPKTVQHNHVHSHSAPILAAALGVKAAERAAAYADGLILDWAPVAQVSKVAVAAAKAAASIGRHAPTIWVLLECFLSSDRRQAARAAASHLRRYMELPVYRRMLEEAGFAAEVGAALNRHQGDAALAEMLGDRLLDDVALLGGREHLSASLDRLAQAGADVVILYPNETGDGWRATLDRALRNLAPGA